MKRVQKTLSIIIILSSFLFSASLVYSNEVNSSFLGLKLFYNKSNSNLIIARQSNNYANNDELVIMELEQASYGVAQDNQVILDNQVSVIINDSDEIYKVLLNINSTSLLAIIVILGLVFTTRIIYIKSKTNNY